MKEDIGGLKKEVGEIKTKLGTVESEVSTIKTFIVESEVEFEKAKRNNEFIQNLKNAIGQ
ncbi:MAG: hypothetical protein ACOYVK_17415 [Bacillota bacterium]